MSDTQQPGRSALLIKFVNAAKEKPGDLYGDAASRVAAVARDGNLCDLAAWNRITDALRTVPNAERSGPAAQDQR